MKTFRQTIQEVSDNKPLSESRVRPMAQNFSVFEDEILDARLSSYFLTEIEFSNSDAFKAYNSQHKMRPTTKVKISGKKTTAKAADPDAFKDKEEPKKEKGVKPTHVKASPAQQKSADKIHKAVKEDLDFIIANASDVRTQGGAGTNSASKEQVQDLGTFTEKRMAQSPDEEPYVHPNVAQREIDDKTLDTSMKYLENNLGEEKYHNLIKFISKGGGVDPFLTKVTKKDRDNSDGFKRSREIIRLYLKNDGKCVVTGERMKLSECEPDHRIPYSSASDLAKEKGISLEEAKRQTDNVQGNMDLMKGPINQFKSSLINDKLLNKINKNLAKTDDAREIKKLENEYKNERSKRLRAHYNESFGNGDYSSMTEENINQMDNNERNTMMKEYNYYHPNSIEYNKQIKKDPDYEQKLEAVGIILPKTEKGKLDTSKPPSSHWLSRYKPTSGSRTRANRRNPSEERVAMVEMFRKSGKECPLVSEQKESNRVVNEQRLKIRKEMNKRQIDIEKIKLKNPKLSDRQKTNIEKKLKKLSEQKLRFNEWNF